jgi:hypothetical protein
MDDISRKFQRDLNAGLVALVLLGVLAETDEDLYGYDIAKRLQRAREGDPIFKEGTIYPVLRSLAAGLVGFLNKVLALNLWPIVWLFTSLGWPFSSLPAKLLKRPIELIITFEPVLRDSHSHPDSSSSASLQ